MSDSTNGYHISFFKPTTPHATANRNMVLWLVIVWFVAIFGFHFLLRIIEKPTPENTYISFQEIWGNIENGTASMEQYQEFGKVNLSVLGKIAIDPIDKVALNNALSWTVYQLTADSLKSILVDKIGTFETMKAEITSISDENYIDAKRSLSTKLSPLLDLSEMDIRSKLLSLELTTENIEVLTEETRTNLPAVMGKYLIHNQSFLTDFKFLGFPFHYFYSAVFLLILFVGLCLIYCIKSDNLNAKLNIID